MASAWATLSGVRGIIGDRAVNIGSGAAGGVAGGLFARQAEYALGGGNGLASNLFDPGSVAGDAALGGAFGAFGSGDAGGGACGVNSNSFVAGTLVSSDKGLVPIESLKVGDKVWAANPETGASGYYTITYTTNHTADEVVELTIGSASQTGSNEPHLAFGILGASERGSASGSSSGPGPNPAATVKSETVEATPQHPFWVIGKGWVNAGQLHVGDKLLTKDGKQVSVLATKLVKKSVQVYNFTVARLHTYFTGQQQLLVHNCGNLGPNNSPNIGNLSPAEIVGDNPEFLPIQDTVTGWRVEKYAKDMLDNNFDWHKMGDKITFVGTKDGNKYLTSGHHRFLAAKLAGIDIPDYAIVDDLAGRRVPRWPNGITWDKVRWDDRPNKRVP